MTVEELRRLPAAERAAEARNFALALRDEASALAKKKDLTKADMDRIDEIERLSEELGELPVEDPINGGPSYPGGHNGLTTGDAPAIGAPLTDRSYRSVCRAAGQDPSMDGWKSSEEFYSALVSGRHHPALKRDAQSSVEGALGGYAVPHPLAARIFDDALESEIVRPRATVIPMNSASLTVPAWDAQDRSTGNLYGGISAHWSGESMELDEDTAKLRQVTLTAQKLAMIGRVPSELIEDSRMFAAQFQTALTGAAAFHLDNAFLNGNGAGQPLGVLNSACKITVDKENGQEAGSVVYENVSKMFARMHPAGRNRCVWICSASAIPALLQMTLNVGTGGSAIQVMSETDGKFRLLTRPVLFTEKLPQVGTEGDILLADLQSYYIGMRVGVTLDVSNAPFFTKDQLAFRLRTRVEGQPIYNAPIQPLNGPTVSPFITLEARTS